MSIDQIKARARELFLTGVRAANPAHAVKRALESMPLEVDPKGRLLIIAFGKAALDMAQEAIRSVPKGQLFQAIAVTNYENYREIPNCEVFAAGHPLPDENGLTAGQGVIELLRSTTPEDRVLCLISGGGSALLPTPRADLSLEDKVKVNQRLLAGGLDIVQMNAVRQQLSELKGGGLTELAAPALVRSLIISDVVGDDIQAIASGPTARPMGRIDETVSLLKARGIWEQLPEKSQQLLLAPKEVGEFYAQNQLICTNYQSLQAIWAEAADWHAEIVAEPLVGDVSDAAQKIIEHGKAEMVNARRLLIFGGETTVNINGSGRGGRNQELSVRVAQLAAALPGQWVFLSGGTDGRDGPTDAAGGLVDPLSLARCQAGGLNVAAALADNDSYRILDASGDLLKVDATGTNVADIQLLFQIAT